MTKYTETFKLIVDIIKKIVVTKLLCVFSKYVSCVFRFQNQVLMYKTEYSFTWKIENFSFCPQSCGSSFKSPKFHVKSLCESDWRLQLFPRGYEDGYANFISCYLLFEASRGVVPAFDIEICIIGPCGRTLKQLEWCDNSTKCDNRWGSPSFLAITEFTQDACNSKEDIVTISCNLQSKNPTADIIDECITHTKIGVDRQFFRWLTEYSEGRFRHGRNVKKFENDCFKFSIVPKEKQISITLKYSQWFSGCFVDCTIFLQDVKKYYIFSERRTFCFQRTNDVLLIPFNVFANELGNIKSSLTYDREKLGKKDVYLICEFSCSNGDVSHFLPNKKNSISIFPANTLENSSLQESMQNLFHNKKLSDVKLRVGDQVIEGHKIILASRSPVFETMFCQDMTETQTGVVDIVDVDIYTLKLFLQFLYTDTVDGMDYEVAANLLIAAEKYQVLPLKEKCSMFLKQEISVENACEIMSLADAVNHTHLKSVAMNFIVENSAAVLSSSHWETWMENNMKLATTIFAKLTILTKNA